MENKTKIAFLIILIAAAFSTLAFVIWPSLRMNNEQANSQTQQVIREFYDWYLTYDGNPLVDHAYRSSLYLSPDMIAFLDEFTQNGMQYDPVLCAQDKPTDINISPARISGRQAAIDVSTNFEGHEFTVDLVQTDGDWLIDKVTCAP